MIHSLKHYASNSAFWNSLKIDHESDVIQLGKDFQIHTIDRCANS